MCCINIDPQAFLDWANPILEKKKENRAKVKAECDAEIKAWKGKPWYKRLFTTAPWVDMFWEDDKLIRLGHYRLPAVGPGMVDLAKYCIAKGKEMPLDTTHDFFKG